MTSFDFDKYVIDKIDLITGISKSTGELYFMMDEIKDGSIENGGEKVFGTGSHGTRISALNTNKTAKVSANNGFIIGGTIEAQTGTDAVIASASNKLVVPNVETIEVVDPTKVTIEYTPVGTSGAEIPYIYKANRDGTQGEKYPIGATASATEFSLKPSDKEITLPTDVFKKGDRVIVIYDYEASAGKKYSNTGVAFAKTCKLIVDVLCRDVCDNETVLHTKFVFPNASIDGNFTITIGNEPAAHAFSAEAMTDVCSSNKTMWDWYVV